MPSARGPVRYTLRRHAHSFFQGNRFLLEPLVGRVLEAVPTGRVLDLYAGVGLFGVAAAARGGAEVVAVEGDRRSADDLRENASEAGGAIVARHQAVEAFLEVERDRRWSLDRRRSAAHRPEQGGAGRRHRAAAPRLVYVSCDVATLARDARLLVDAGYALRSLEAFDCFPIRRTSRASLYSIDEDSMPYFALFYETVDDYVGRRAQFREQHLTLARDAHARGELLLAGALADPVDRALLIFRAADKQAVEEFATPRSVRDQRTGAPLGSAALDRGDRQRSGRAGLPTPAPAGR